MAFQEGTETLTCPDCGAKHTARWSRMPFRESQKVRCRACPGLIVNGKLVHDYYDVTLTSGE